MRANRQLMHSSNNSTIHYDGDKESTKMKYHWHTVFGLDLLTELEIFERDLSRVTENHYM